MSHKEDYSKFTIKIACISAGGDQYCKQMNVDLQGNYLEFLIEIAWISANSDHYLIYPKVIKTTKLFSDQFSFTILLKVVL